MKSYLIKIASNDVIESSRIDTSTSREVPLQCTEAFFDSKKTVTKSKQCMSVNLCYNRKKKYLGNYTVQLSIKNGYLFIKTHYYPEKGDIQHVLQTVFEAY